MFTFEIGPLCSAFIDFWYFWLVENSPVKYTIAFMSFNLNSYLIDIDIVWLRILCILISHITNELRHLPFRQWPCNHCHSISVFRVLWRVHLAQSVEGQWAQHPWTLRLLYSSHQCNAFCSRTSCNGSALLILLTCIGNASK